MNAYTPNPQTQAEAEAVTQLAITSLKREPLPALAIWPVSHPRAGIADPNSRTFWMAVANALYIRREEGIDLFGPTPNLAAKLAQGNDLIEYG